MMKILRRSLFPLLVVSIIALLYVFIPPFTTGQSTSNDTFNGYAWSQNIGWISLNCNQPAWGLSPASDICEISSDYKVSVDFNTGNLSGYAWSPNIGWIDFAPSGPYPQLPNNAAKLINVSSTTCGGDNPREISGWVRAVSYVDADGITRGYGGGWDGWIKMSGDTNEVTPRHYGVCLTPDGKALTGHAWGGGTPLATSPQLVGWVQFDPAYNSLQRASPIIEITPN